MVLPFSKPRVGFKKCREWCHFGREGARKVLATRRDTTVSSIPTDCGLDDDNTHWNNRIAPLLEGEEGEKLRKQVWFEVMDALSKEVPDILDMAKV